MFSSCLRGFPVGAPLGPTIKNMHPKFIIQPVTSTKCTDRDVDLVSRRRTMVAHCSIEEDGSNASFTASVVGNQVFT